MSANIPQNNKNGKFSTPLDAVDLAEIWGSTKFKLHTQMTQATYDAVINNATLVEVKNGVYVIDAGTKMAKEWLENRLLVTVERALSDIISEPASVLFTVREPEPEAEQPAPEEQTTQLADNTPLSTNDVVLEVGSLNFEGNIIPASWYEHLKYDSGKPNTNAIIILSEIVYWYRPVEIRDEKSGRVTGYRKKFKADKLQRSYQSFATQFGFTKKQARDAITFLAEQGVITKELRDIQTEDGTPLSNVLYLEVVPSRLRKITYPRRLSDSYDLQVTPSDL